MVPRKTTRKTQKDNRKPLRFTSGEIVLAIDAVQAAGLTVSVLISLDFAETLRTASREFCLQ
jgi:hypothetical protein